MLLLITAHPGDESMFFIPTLKNIIDRTNRRQRWAVVDAGEGQSIHRQSTASTEKGSTFMKSAMNLNILTFDQGGVSGHPKHSDVFHGIQYLLNEKCSNSYDNNTASNDDTDQRLDKTRTILRLWSETIAKKDSNNPNDDDKVVVNRNNIILDVNVNVYTLKTISNPFQKDKRNNGGLPQALRVGMVV
jgi:hypothetical protein